MENNGMTRFVTCIDLFPNDHAAIDTTQWPEDLPGSQYCPMLEREGGLQVLADLIKRSDVTRDIKMLAVLTLYQCELATTDHDANLNAQTIIRGGPLSAGDYRSKPPHITHGIVILLGL
ncbi:unnamed protein product, partial [Oppiella nova]